MLRDLEHEGEHEPPPPAPPVPAAPPIVYGIPAPDWRAEEQERAQREAAESEPEPEGTREEGTPNLDRVKSWKGASR
jgi:hypothetical protein